MADANVLNSLGSMFTGAENAIGGAFNSGANAIGSMFGGGPSAYESGAAGGPITGSAADAAGVAKSLGGTQMPAALNQGLSAAQGNLGAGLNTPVTAPQIPGAGGAGGIGGISTAMADALPGASGANSGTGFNIGPVTGSAPSYDPNAPGSTGAPLKVQDVQPTTSGGAGNYMAGLSPTAAPGAATGAAQPDMMHSLVQGLMDPKNIPRELSTALTGVNLMNAMQPNPLQKQMQHQLDNARNQQALYQNRVNTDQAGGVSPAQQAALDLERQQARARILSQPGGILSAHNADLQAVDTAINKQQFDEAQANLAQDAKLMGAYDTDTQNYLSNLLKLEQQQSGQFNQSLASLFQALGMGNPANYNKQQTP